MTLPAELRSKRDSMIARCYRPSHTRYTFYGARGIRVCDEWRYDLAAFCQWAIDAGWRPGMEIDRIDPSGDYEPSNCRFATRSQNLANRRKFHTAGKSATASRFIGVRRCGNRFTARIKQNGHNVYLGMFRREEDAAIAYDRAARDVHGEFARLNFSGPLPCPV